MSTEFNTVFRIGHTQVNSPFVLMNDNGKIVKSLSLGEIFLNPNLVTKDTLGPILNGMLRIKYKERSLEMVNDMRNFLVSEELGGAKIDLFSTNIQRGRDHGICSYKKAREQLDLPDKSFSQIFDDPGS